MSMVGRREDLALPDVLQILYAASDSVWETLGNILLCQKHLPEPTLTAALEAQHRSPDSPLLGAPLVERGDITREVLERCVRQQIEGVIFEFRTWQEGFCTFEPCWPSGTATTRPTDGPSSISRGWSSS